MEGPFVGVGAPPRVGQVRLVDFEGQHFAPVVDHDADVRG